jgi:hypothetical protein
MQQKTKGQEAFSYETLREKRGKRNSKPGIWAMESECCLKRGILPFFALEDVRGSSENPLFLQDREPVNLAKPLQAKC